MSRLQSATTVAAALAARVAVVDQVFGGPRERVVGSEDLSFEHLARNSETGQYFESIQKMLVKECLEMCEDHAKKNEYKMLDERFEKRRKLEVHDDSTNRTTIARLLRFRTRNLVM